MKQILLSAVIAMSLGIVGYFLFHKENNSFPKNEKLFADAIKYAGYEKHCQKYACIMPDVFVVDLPGDILGAFAPTQHRLVFIDKEIAPGSFAWQAALVHEFTHYLQWNADKIPDKETCEQNFEREIEAYETEVKWALREKGILNGYAIRGIQDMKKKQELCNNPDNFH